MYSTRPNLVLGFHGCDKTVVDKVVNQKEEFKKSANVYDWLGHGFYFWENNPQRAMDFAKENVINPVKTKGEIKEPAVLGAVIDLGHCLDLLESKSLNTLKIGFETLTKTCEEAGIKIPTNKPTNIESEAEDLLIRELDCAVIQAIHKFNKDVDKKILQSVRAAFIEGNPVYPGAMFKDKNHIQICVRDFNCIKGFFIPRTLKDDGFLHLKD